MKILVTGGTGFIGSHLTRRLRELYPGIENEIYTVGRNRVQYRLKKNKEGIIPSGYFFYSPVGSDVLGYCQKAEMHIQCDLTDSRCVQAMMRQFRPDVIFHLAANPLTKMDESNPFQIIHDNTLATQYLCEYAPEGCRFIFASSIVVYGTTYCSVPKEYSSVNPTSLYGVSKFASEGIVSVYTQLGKIKGVSLRLCATVGSGVTHGVIHDFIKKLKSDNEHLEMLGDEPGSKKPYIHVDDAVSAFILMLNRFHRTGSWNVCSNDNITIRTLANAVMVATEITKPRKWLGSAANWKGDNPELMANNQQIMDLVWQPKYRYAKDAVMVAVKDIMETE